MKKVALMSLLSNILFSAEAVHGEAMRPLFMIGFIGSLLMVGVLFWAFYKAIKTKNPKYGYLMVFSIVMMVVFVLL